MRNRQNGKWADVGLRLGGLMFCALSWFAFRGLAALHLSQTHSEPGMEAAALAAATFLCASVGAILMAQGNHIFDEVDVSERWRTRFPPDTDPL